MYYYCAHYRRLALMTRQRQQRDEPHAGKRRLLQKMLALQRRKLAAAEVRATTPTPRLSGDACSMSRC